MRPFIICPPLPPTHHLAHLPYLPRRLFNRLGNDGLAPVAKIFREHVLAIGEGIVREREAAAERAAAPSAAAAAGASCGAAGGAAGAAKAKPPAPDSDDPTFGE